MRTSTLISEITLVALLAAVMGCGSAKANLDKKVIIIGIDGLDPRLLEQFMDQGRLPNFARLASEGDRSDLQTSMPPLSPVAWSNFITGLDPGGHAIFDFLHRDPETLAPYDAIYRVGDPGRRLELGSWVLPLSGGSVELLRQGRALWELLEEAGVPTTIFRMPVNFPPVEAGGRSLSGMGTPDILGTHGTFSFYTDYPPANAKTIAGGVVHLVEVIDSHVRARVVGPRNTFRRFPKRSSPSAAAAGRAVPIEYENPDLTADFDVFLDPEAAAAKIVVDDTEFVLNEGDWSDWVPVRFEAVPFPVSVGAAARFYLQQVRPDFKLYVSPLQIDPADPALPISTPTSWSRELADRLGRFYTQELPEDTKAFTAGIFSGREFWGQSQFVYHETRRALDELLSSFDQGLLFFYFSTVDQSSHMLFRYRDEQHPAYVPDDQLRAGLATLYEEMDDALGRVLEAVDDRTTVIVMSDHGFAPFYWGVNLNSWLVEKGYVALKDPTRRDGVTLFANVDWSNTTAYAVGLNGLYVNLKGREQHGIVEPGAPYDALLDRLERDLLATRDPRNDRQPVTLVYRTRQQLHGPYIDRAPDIVVGYGWGYRSSWQNPLGEFPRQVFVDNIDPWSGDHSMDYRLVPGVLVTNRRITLERPALYDLTVAVLDEFGVAPLPEMVGKDSLAPR